MSVTMFKKLRLPKEVEIRFDQPLKRLLIESEEYDALKRSVNLVVENLRQRTSFADSLFSDVSRHDIIGVGTWMQPNPLRVHIAHTAVVHLPPSLAFIPIQKIQKGQIGIAEGVFSSEMPLFELRTFVKLRQKSALLSIRKYAIELLEKESGEDILSKETICGLVRTIKLIDNWFGKSNSITSSDRFSEDYDRASLAFIGREQHEFDSVPRYFAEYGAPNITDLAIESFEPLISLANYDF